MQQSLAPGFMTQRDQTQSLVELVYLALKEEETRLSLAKGRSNVRSVVHYDENIIHHLILREWTRYDRQLRLDHTCIEKGIVDGFRLVKNDRSVAFFEVKGPLQSKAALATGQREATKLRELGYEPGAGVYSIFIAIGNGKSIESVRSERASAWSQLLLLNTGDFLIVGVIDAREGIDASRESLTPVEDYGLH